MAQIIGALKGDAADVFDFTCHHGKKHTDAAPLLWKPYVPSTMEYH